MRPSRKSRASLTRLASLSFISCSMICAAHSPWSEVAWNLQAPSFVFLRVSRSIQVKDNVRPEICTFLLVFLRVPLSTKVEKDADTLLASDRVDWPKSHLLTADRVDWPNKSLNISTTKMVQAQKVARVSLSANYTSPKAEMGVFF